MSIVTLSPPVTRQADPHPRRWTKEEYYQLAELGFFNGQHADLIEGEIMVLSPQNFPHSFATDQSGETLRDAFGAAFWVRTQLPINLTPLSEPEPDVSVVPGQRQDYTAHPTTAVLVVEVSETTLAYDQTDKASLYARAGIRDYWIVNLVQGQVEVYRDPVPDATQAHGHRYSSATIHPRGTTVTPLVLPAVPVPVDALLP